MEGTWSSHGKLLPAEEPDEDEKPSYPFLKDSLWFTLVIYPFLKGFLRLFKCLFLRENIGTYRNTWDSYPFLKALLKGFLSALLSPFFQGP